MTTFEAAVQIVAGMARERQKQITVSGWRWEPGTPTALAREAWLIAQELTKLAVEADSINTRSVAHSPGPEVPRATGRSPTE